MVDIQANFIVYLRHNGHSPPGPETAARGPPACQCHLKTDFPRLSILTLWLQFLHGQAVDSRAPNPLMTNPSYFSSLTQCLGTILKTSIILITLFYISHS